MNHAMSPETIICTLCQHEIPAAHLRARREEEPLEITTHTIQLIKEDHPEWTERDPVCQRCWDEYRSTFQI